MSGTMETKGNVMGRDIDNYTKWRKENLRQFVIKFNRAKEKDVIDHLEKQTNIRQYLIRIIRKDINGS